jgi:hypothetical protein
MENKTISERLFEKYCTENNIYFHRIDTSIVRTPDYELIINDSKVIIEIKQIDRDNNETVLPLIGYSHKVGDKIRQKVIDSKKQIRKYSKDGYKTLLVIYNNMDGLHLQHTEPMDFADAMYGERTILLKVNRTETQLIKSYFGKKKRFTESDNTSFSGIAHLKPEFGKLKLNIYKNTHAKHKITNNLFNNLKSVDVYEIKNPNDYQEWVKI